MRGPYTRWHLCFLLFSSILAPAAWGNNVCFVEDLLKNNTPVDDKLGDKLYTVINGPCESSGPGPVVLQRNWTVSGPPSPPSSWDLLFLARAYQLPPGAVLSLESLWLQHVRFESPQTAFLNLSAFSTGTLDLSYVHIDTDCYTVQLQRALADAILQPGTFSAGEGYLYVEHYSVPGVISAQVVNITCAWPRQYGSPVPGGQPVVIVNDSLSLRNGIAYVQSGQDFPLFMVSNITLNALQWSAPLQLGRNVTLTSRADTLNVLDLQGMISQINLLPGAHFMIDNIHMINLSPLRGSGLDSGGILPLFAIPIWWFNFTRISTEPQIWMENCTLTLSTSEFEYFTLWAMVVTTNVASVSEAAAAIRAGTPIVELGTATNRNSLNFKHLRSVGADVLNYTITNTLPSSDFPVVVPDNVVPEFSVQVLSNISQVPAYDVTDLKSILDKMQASPPATATAVWVWRNITIDPAAWPPGGYTITTPLILVGGSASSPSWIDLGRIANFISVSPSNGDVWLYCQWVQLVNLPNALAPTPAPGAGVGAANASSNSSADFTLPMSGFKRSGPVLFFNMSRIVVTYHEYKALQNMLLPNSPFQLSGSGKVMGSAVSYNLSRIYHNVMEFTNFYGFNWIGSMVNITYDPPDGVTLMYQNEYEPPSPPPYPPGANAPSGGDGGDSHPAWLIAVIVVSCVVAVGLVVGFIAWRVVVRYRDELQSVKGGGGDKDSTTQHKSSSSNEVNVNNHSAPQVATTPPAQQVTDPSHIRVKIAGNDDSEYNSNGTQPGGASPERCPMDELNSMMQALTAEIDDQHLIILDVLGQGGFGTVYKGMWKGLLVAVKTITFQDRVVGGDKAQHRAILEAAISSSLAHANVVTTYSYDIKPLRVHQPSNEGPDSNGTATTGGTGLRITEARVTDWKLYIIQEYCDAGSLRLAVLKRKFFDAKRNEPRVEMILDTALELAGGLVHLHEKNIIHGDLNPNNVLLKRDAARKYGAICKLADFGLSVKMAADQSHISNMRRGTPFYTAPEVSQKGNMTKAADVYSFGVMLWECYHSCMCYRSSPTAGFSARETFPRFPRRTPAELVDLVSACIAPEPVQRPAMADVAGRLAGMIARLKRGELRTVADELGSDPEGDAAHMAGCLD